MLTIRLFLLSVMVMAAVAAASATDPCPKNTSIKNQLIGFDSGKSAASLRRHRECHQNEFDSLTISNALSDRALKSDNTVSLLLHVFLPTILPLLDDLSKNIFKRVVIEFVISYNDDETLPIHSIGNIMIEDQELAWSSESDELDGLRTPGIEVFFRADASVSRGLAQQEVEQGIQFMFDSKSTVFHKMFYDANGGHIDETSSPSPAPSTKRLDQSTMPSVLSVGVFSPATQLPPAPSTAKSPNLTVGPPGPSTQPTPPMLISEPPTKVPDPSIEVAGTGSTLLIVGVISTTVGCVSFVGTLLLCARFFRKRMKNNCSDEKAPLETTMQTDDKEDNNDRSESSITQGDNNYLQRAFRMEQRHSERELLVSDTDSEYEDPHQHITLSALAKDSIDMSMFFQCDGSAIASSIASSTNSSDDSYNYSQKSTITAEDLENFDNDLRQSEC